MAKDKRRPDISIIIPFRTDHGPRQRAFSWLVRYWRHELPDAEIIIGHSANRPFSKTEALNNAIHRSHGRVLVLIDSDAYLRGKVITRCANRILEDLDDRLWFVPYRKLYRLNQEASERILRSNPRKPLRPADPPPPEDLDGPTQKSSYGHRYGALCLIIPREAYDTLGCFDESFSGWGGEDVCMLRALDTLYGKHKTTKNSIFHLWHPVTGHNYRTRSWSGQETNNPNDQLAMKYHRATRHPAAMRLLVDRGCELRRRRRRARHWMVRLVERFLNWLREWWRGWS
jgi:glycosyltransferase involved in cell wall biosynthesis